MSNFQPEIIEKVADELMKKAKSVITTNALVGFFLLFSLSAILSSAGNNGSFDGVLLPSFLVGLLGAGIGYMVGKTKALSLKVEAQKLLLDIQIEKNTRKG